MKNLIVLLFFTAVSFTSLAQEKIYQIDEISVINYGDGRLLFRQLNSDKTPLQGAYRLIDGYRSEYLLAEFKDGMYNRTFQHFKSNKLKEEGTYIEGRKDGIYKEYYSDGKQIKKETPYKAGKLNGTIKSYYTDGKLESEKGYTMSVEDGVERKYDYQNGAITVDKNYKDGVLHGPQTINYTSNIGDFIERSNYNQGKRVGEFSETFTDGTIKTMGQYDKDGKKDGQWIERDNFSEKGNDKFSGKLTVYKNGEIVKEEEVKNFTKFQNKK